MIVNMSQKVVILAMILMEMTLDSGLQTPPDPQPTTLTLSQLMRVDIREEVQREVEGVALKVFSRLVNEIFQKLT